MNCCPAARTKLLSVVSSAKMCVAVSEAILLMSPDERYLTSEEDDDDDDVGMFLRFAKSLPFVNVSPLILITFLLVFFEQSTGRQ